MVPVSALSDSRRRSKATLPPAKMVFLLHVIREGRGEFADLIG